METEAKKSTALATVDTFQIVTGTENLDEELVAELEDEMEDLDDVKGISCKHIKIPSGGGKAYEIEGDDPDDPEIAKEIEAVIIFTHRMNSYWEGEFGATAEDGSPNFPKCSSMDGKVGVEFESGEVKNCENCPLNQYAEDGSGKQCKNIRRLYLLISGKPGIYLLSVPPTSIKDVNKQLAKIMGIQKIPYSKMVIRLKLEVTKNRNDIKYSKVVIEKAGILPREVWPVTSAMRRELKEKYKDVAITSDDYGQSENTESNSVDTSEFVSVDDATPEGLPFN